MNGTSRQQPTANLQFQEKMRIAWGNFRGSMLLILSGEDYTAKEFLEYAQTDSAWSSALQQPNVHRYDMKNADHTFADLKHSREVEVATIHWLTGLRPSNGVYRMSYNSN